VTTISSSKRLISPPQPLLPKRSWHARAGGGNHWAWRHAGGSHWAWRHTHTQNKGNVGRSLPRGLRLFGLFCCASF
jgi:hypothetical protein